MAWAVRADHNLHRNFLRILAWFVASGLLWISGIFATGETRVALWLAALAIEYASPAAGFATPGLGRSTTADWASISGGHLAERCALFIIIALGESVLVAGATFCNQAWGTDSVLAFATAFTGTIAMWWIYFDRSVELGSARISSAADPGRLGRLAYTYVHLPIVAGIILAAVGDELLLAHPYEQPHTSAIVAIVGGPLLYVAGAVLFKHAIRGWFQLSHLVGIALLGVVALVGSWLSTLALAAVVTGVLLVVAVWESVSLSRASLEAGLRARP
jgi:low temperature requirement protein LtrA